MPPRDGPQDPSARRVSVVAGLLVVGLFLTGLAGIAAVTAGVSVRAQAPAEVPGAAPASRQAEGTGPEARAGEQPIAFSHRVHAGDNDLACEYCHSFARRGPVAGIPSVQRCVQCHRSIATEAAEIGRLMAFWDAGQPIPWLRVHDLPDFVRFTHKRHVVAGVACATCHGDVARMQAAERSAPLTMGWCLDCHAERAAPVDCLTCHY